MLSCKSPEPASLDGEEPVSFKAFTSIFPNLELPLVVADSTFQRKDKDSTAIKPKLFGQFIPDSIQLKLFGKSRPKLYPLGKTKGEQQYLFVKTIAGDKKGAYVFVFDKKENLLAGFPLLQLDNLASTQQNSIFDRKNAIYKNITRRNADGTISEGKDVYSYDPSMLAFGLVFTDALDDKAPDLVNPIDTLPRKHKFSADYGTGKNNMISFRDGRKTDRLTFFLHFEKAGDCNGELKGEAILRTATMAEYREAGDPCSIQFNFTANAVTVKEIDGCGAHRGLRCSFNGSYARKKISKAKAKKTKK